MVISYKPDINKINPIITPITKLKDFKSNESLNEYDNIGSIPCPSCTIELVNKTENGINP